MKTADNFKTNKKMNGIIKFKKLLIMVAAMSLLVGFAIKPYYGGEITIRLNEPDSFSYTPSSYSNMIFYSLVYENLFYLKPDGEIYSHVFKEYQYDSQTRTLNLVINDYLCFSNGKPVTPENIKLSLSVFLDMNLASSRRLGQTIRSIRTVPPGPGSRADSQRLIIDLAFDVPDIVSALTAPELILVSSDEQVFSGPFYPVEWVKNQYMILKSNPFYPGGRSFLDSIKVVFYDFHYPDIFLSEPGLGNPEFSEVNAGIFQNIYLVFPQGKVGDNTRIALYSLLKKFYQDQNMVDLDSLTANEESPVTLDIKTFSDSQMRSILRYGSIRLFIVSSLKKIEEPFNQFLEKKRASIETVFVGDNQLTHFLDNNSVRFLLVTKTFNSRMPINEKIKIILKEMSFGRFDEEYLKLLNELDEMKNMQNNELMMDVVSRIIERVINDRFLLPLYQKRFSLYIKKAIKGIELDYYGKPLFQKARLN